MTKNYAYELLKLPYGADPDQIKKSYASLILQYKPDEYPLEFMQIHEAYKLLTSSLSSSMYVGLQDVAVNDADYTPDEWAFYFNQMDEEHDIRMEKEKKLEEEQRREEELRQKQELERRKKQQIQEQNEYRKKRQLEHQEELRKKREPKLKLDYVISAALLLFLYDWYIVKLPVILNLGLCVVFLFYKIAVFRLRKNRQWKPYNARFLVSLLCTAMVFVLVETLAEPDTIQMDWGMMQFVVWFDYCFITGFIASVKASLRKIRGN